MNSVTTTGCCGVKKQKLHHNNCRVANGHLSTSTNCLDSIESGVGGGSGLSSSSEGAEHRRLNGVVMANGTLRSGSGAGGPYDDHNAAMDEDEDGDEHDFAAGPSAGTRSHFHQNGVMRNGGRTVPCRPRVVSKDMVTFCFEVLECYLNGLDAPKNPKFANDHFPLFVTWKVGKERKLRGCIGTFNCTSLHQGLREYAVTSACKDSRFDPINPDEINRLHCSVSLLMDFEIADHYLDWEIGVHGIRIEFSSDRGSKKAATYLPEVAVEQGWNHIQTVDSLLRKGGYKGTITPDIRASVCVIRFQSDKLTISYSEYLAHRKQKQEVDKVSSDGSYHPHHHSNGFLVQNGYHHSSGNSSSCSGGSSRSKHRFFPSLGVGSSSSSSSSSSSHHHRYPTRNSEGRHPSGSSVGIHHQNHHISSHHPSSVAARYLQLPSHPYMQPPV